MMFLDIRERGSIGGGGETKRECGGDCEETK